MLYDVIIIGTGPASLGAAFHLIENKPTLKILLIDKEKICSGGLLNDCKQMYTFPIGFATEYWTKEEADNLLPLVEKHLNPEIKDKTNFEKYQRRSEKLGVTLLNIKQAHVGTDKSKLLILSLLEQLKNKGVEIALQTEVLDVDQGGDIGLNIKDKEKIYTKILIIAPGRKGFSFLQQIMEKFKINYVDNTVDVGIRVETRIENYPIVKDYYDPKFLFPKKVRTFCTNSGHASVVKEKYNKFFLVNGHALSAAKGDNGLVNFALLKTIGLKEPVRSGQQMAVFLARLANEVGGGNPIMQRVGDFRRGKRSYPETFNHDLYDFKPTCQVTAGDLGLVVPSKIMKDLWDALNLLDGIIPGLLHPATVLYYPELKYYANKPEFIDDNFQVKDKIYMIGDGAGTSRGITGAWASGIRAAKGIILDSFLFS